MIIISAGLGRSHMARYFQKNVRSQLSRSCFKTILKKVPLKRKSALLVHELSFKSNSL
ncbi:hypothetical protein FD15_GL002150 [Liquorilactobacillus sucicola DSM 21376 = JCM 15457]|uniref:Uncharacterized protein n=1 Tax=Liquorilactobacillus sucicola DSM 21376 = JCM 15457 TaxID=1423806 RepID=A0A0R2DQ73_9LACO|nr:hypothetical protein FD15_GL002150 [Liquorilactobacillus sucicola DSM 21376 = JCM 15457]